MTQSMPMPPLSPSFPSSSSAPLAQLRADLASARARLTHPACLAQLRAATPAPPLEDVRVWLARFSAALVASPLMCEEPAAHVQAFSPFSLGCPTPEGYDLLAAEEVVAHLTQLQDDRAEQIVRRRVLDARLTAFPDPRLMGRFVSPADQRVWPEWTAFEDFVTEFGERDVENLEISASLSLPFNGRLFCFRPDQFPGLLTPWPFEALLRSMDLLPGDQLVRWLQWVSTRLSWWVPTQSALDRLISWCGGSLVELGSGAGLAARLLRDRATQTGQALELTALDDFSWETTCAEPWTRVERGSPADLQGCVTPLLVAWPPRDGELLLGALRHWSGSRLALVLDLQVEQPYAALDRLSAAFSLSGWEALPSADCGVQVLTFWDRRP